ncbi:uncharacterized protein [Apostichopus japonicus]|uniref:uncharacterized protein isoform X2 n=1 Tax=Stichopus japonicus TaxID=307972 RepID=UPI003AB5F6E8
MATVTKEISQTLKRKPEEQEDEEGSCDEESLILGNEKNYKPIIMERKDGTPLKKRRKKRVSFDGVTVFYFPRSQGFTSVPSQGGATLGMSPKHDTIQKFTLAEFAQLQELSHRTALKSQLLQRRRDQMLRSNCDFQETALDEDVEEEINQIAIGDYYFLQPVPTKQRRLLLRTSGVRKIDRTEKLELKKIRISRESCGCDCAGYCDPQKCQCSLAGIKCQVDRMSFPCGCTKDYCQNEFGRIEFNPIKVREHFISTMQKLEWEDYGSENESSNELSSPEREPQFAGQTESLDSSQSSFSSSSYVFSNSLSKDLHNDGFRSEHFPSFPSSSFQSPGYSSISSEGGIPIRIESCQSLNASYGPQKLHFNDPDDSPVEGDPSCGIVGLSSTPSYDSSEDSVSSSSEASSTSGGDHLGGQAGGHFYFHDAQEFPGPSEESSEYPDENEGGNNREEQTGKTYTELTQSSTLQSFGQFPSITQSMEGQGLPPMGSIFQSLVKSRQEPAVTLGMLTDGISPQLYSTYTSSMTANSFEEMKETALATNSITPVSSGLYTVQGLNLPKEAAKPSSPSATPGNTSWQRQYFSVGDGSDSLEMPDKESSLDCEREDKDEGTIPKKVESTGAMSAGCTNREGNHDNIVVEEEEEEEGEDGDTPLEDSEDVEDEGRKKLSEEEERDSSDSSSDSAVFSGTEDPCAPNDLEESSLHSLPCDASNDSGLGVSQDGITRREKKLPKKEKLLVECDAFIVDGTMESPVPGIFKPMTTLPILKSAVAD